MKTNSKIFLIALALVAMGGRGFAQQFVVRAEAGLAAANKGPYDRAGGDINLYFGRTLDAAGQHELSFSVGVLAWDESEIDRSYHGDSGAVTLWIDDEKFSIPSNNTHFTFRDGNMTIDDGSVYRSNYRPELSIVPLLANYRFTLGSERDPVRFFAGAGAGIAELNMETKLWRRFEYDQGWWDWSRRDSDDKWSFTWNATAGINIRMSHRLTLDFSYAFQQFQGATFHMEGVSFKLDNMNVHIGRAGVTWKF